MNYNKTYWRALLLSCFYSADISLQEIRQMEVSSMSNDECKSPYSSFVNRYVFDYIRGIDTQIKTCDSIKDMSFTGQMNMEIGAGYYACYEYFKNLLR